MKTMPRFLPFLLLAFPILLLIGCYQFNNPVDPDSPNYQGYPSEPGWLEGWGYRKMLQMSNSSGKAEADYAIKIVTHYGSGSDSEENVYLGSHSRTDFADVRFTSSDSETVFDYWMMGKSDGIDAVLWVEMPSIPASGNFFLFCYYGNGSAASQSNGENTFLLFDDFEADDIDTGKWKGDIDSTDPIGWYAADGSAVCASSYKIIYGNVDYVDCECLASVKLDTTTDGFIGVRGKNTGLTNMDNRYDLFFDRYNGYLRLRLVTNVSPGVDLDSQPHSYVSDYFNAEIAAVGDGSGGYNLFGAAESTETKTTLSAQDDTYDQGRVCLGTESVGSGAMRVDWIAVRPLINPEPSYDGWGDEESD
jgi:hypothetical protein